MILAGFIPPPDPSDSPEEILELFREDTDAIRLGLIITAAASALLVPWAIAITVQMRRIEGPHSVLAFTQGAQGTLVSLEFIISCMIMFMPAGIVVFFKDGAFAWNGLLSFWTVLVVFCAWVMTAYVMLVRAIKQQALEGEPESVA